MRHWPRATYWDLAEKLDLIICDAGPAGCRKKWSPRVHKQGRVDQIGMLHWDGFNRKATNRGLYLFMVQAAYCKNRSFRNEPDFIGLYHASAWAYKEARRVFKIQLPYEFSVKNRAKVKRLAKRQGISLRYQHTNVFWWANWKPERAKIKRTDGGAM